MATLENLWKELKVIFRIIYRTLFLGIHIDDACNESRKWVRDTPRTPIGGLLLLFAVVVVVGCDALFCRLCWSWKACSKNEVQLFFQSESASLGGWGVSQKRKLLYYINQLTLYICNLWKFPTSSSNPFSHSSFMQISTKQAGSPKAGTSPLDKRVLQPKAQQQQQQQQQPKQTVSNNNNNNQSAQNSNKKTQQPAVAAAQIATKTTAATTAAAASSTTTTSAATTTTVAAGAAAPTAAAATSSTTVDATSTNGE